MFQEMSGLPQYSAGKLAIGDDGRVAWEVAGEGAGLLFIHAGIADRRMWDAQFAEFARDQRVVRFDLRGWGESPLPPYAFSWRDDIAMLLHELEIASAVIVGASFGGRIALEFALEYPNMVEALVLVGSALGGYKMSEALDAFEEQIGAAVAAGDIAAAAEIDLRVWVDGPQRAPDAVDPAYREQARVMAERVYVAARDEPQGTAPLPLTPPAIERLAELRVPVLIITGSLDQPDMLRIAEILEEGIEGARSVVMPGTAHLPSMEQPAEFNAILREFLEQLPERRRRGVHLREIGQDNWEACVKLEVAEEQRGYLEPNAVSIAESRFHPWMLPLAIYHDDEVIGFVMYSHWPDPRLPRYWIHRFMIDRRQQGRGYGTTAMRELIERIAQRPGCEEIWIGYVPQNDLARGFYASLGFLEQGEAPWGGDIIAKLDLRS